MSKSRLPKFLKRAIPLWLVIVLVVDSTFVVGLVEYYFMKRNFNQNLIELAKTTNNPDQLVELLKKEVLPAKGYTTPLKWKNIGKQLVEVGAIDLKKYEQIFNSDSNGKADMKYLTSDSEDNMKINEQNSRFMVNTLWALGLVNKSKVLDEGPMVKQGRDKAGNFASTGGWTLGTKDAMVLYSSKAIIPLTDKQEELVKKIAENIFRPCCGNSVYFPDCNHGMAALGYIEWAVYNNLSEEQIYKDVLALNVAWFPEHYVKVAAYLDKQGKKWKDMEPQVLLSGEYSSGQAAQKINQAVQDIPAFKSQGGSCGA